MTSSVSRYLNLESNRYEMSITTTHYVAALARHAQRLGLDIDLLLENARIPVKYAQTDNALIRTERLVALIQSIWEATDHETMGFDPEPLQRGMWALCSEFMLGAETLGEMYQRGSRALQFLPPDSLQLQLHQSGETATIEYANYAGERDPDHFLNEFMGARWYRFACWAIDEQFMLQKVWMNYPAPPHEWTYEQLFQCDVTFDGPTCGFSFNSKYLSKPLVRSHQELQLWLQDTPTDLLNMPGRETSVSSRVKAELLRQFTKETNFSSFKQLCESLHMSPQVTRRRLSEEGTSFQKMKDSVRCDRACQLLSNSDLPINLVAERIGFSEPAALNRAFKKWTGQTPAQYREIKSSRL